MIVKYFIVQKNKKEERKNKFLFQKDEDIVINGMEVEFKNKFYIVMEQEIINKSVCAYCYEFKKPKSEKNTQNTTSGDPEDGRYFE